MYMAEVFLDKKLMGVRGYERYKHALPDAIDNDSGLYLCLPEDKLMDFGALKIITAS